MLASRYDFWAGDFDLSCPVRNRADDEAEDLCRHFSSVSAEVRTELRQSLNTDDFQALWMFSMRSAVFALADQAPAHLVSGLTAVAMINPKWFDFRDVSTAVSLLKFSGSLLDGVDIAALFRDASTLALPDVAGTMLAALSRSGGEGWVQVRTASGLGVIPRGFRLGAGLEQIIVEFAAVFRADRYHPASISVGEEMPRVWLQEVDDSALEDALLEARRGATLNASLRPSPGVDHEDQMLMAFLVETTTPVAAAWLLRITNIKKHWVGNIALLGVKEGKLFALVVQRAVKVGKVTFESAATLARFENQLISIFKKFAR